MERKRERARIAGAADGTARSEAIAERGRRRRPRPSRPTATLLLLAFAASIATVVAACGTRDDASGETARTPTVRASQTTPPGLPRGAEPVTLDAANFTTRIDNPYWPMTPGSRWVYRETQGRPPRDRVVTTVTNRTKVVAGVTARVVHDVATRGGRKIEDTSDWFAQDRAGNVWYLGEATRGYRNGRLRSSGGSWEAGVDGAQAGVVVPAHPQPGLEYRQEYRKGRAEDAARVLDLDAQVDVPAGHFGGVLLTKEFTPIEPRALELKFYAKGVGLVLSLDVSGDSSREVLVSYRKGGG
jgi:hypothetical protein